MNDDLDEDDIPESAFTGPAPVGASPERKSQGGPQGPACPDGCKDEEGRLQKTWQNETRNGKPYFRCGVCKCCWWPQKNSKGKIDPDSKWPPLPSP